VGDVFRAAHAFFPKQFHEFVVVRHPVEFVARPQHVGHLIGREIFDLLLLLLPLLFFKVDDDRGVFRDPLPHDAALKECVHRLLISLARSDAVLAPQPLPLLVHPVLFSDCVLVFPITTELLHLVLPEVLDVRDPFVIGERL